MSEISDMFKLEVQLELAKKARVGMELTCFDVIELLGELNSLKTCIAELGAERRWIPVSERLPEVEKPVLVCTALNGYTEVDQLFFNPTVIEDEVRFYRVSNVTHWMPLPELPEECKCS